MQFFVRLLNGLCFVNGVKYVSWFVYYKVQIYLLKNCLFNGTWAQGEYYTQPLQVFHFLQFEENTRDVLFVQESLFGLVA